MDAARHRYRHALTNRNRSLRETARLTCRHAPAAAARPGTPRAAPRAAAAVRGQAEDRAPVVEPSHGYVVVEVGCALDITSAPALTDVLIEAVDSGEPAVVVDLSAVRVLATAGIACLQDTADLLAACGRHLLLVCPPCSAAARVFRLLDLHATRPVHPDLSAALATLTGRP